MQTAYVLLHGFTGGPASFARVAAGLYPAPVVCPALLGHGAGEGPAPTDFDGEVDRVMGEIRRHLGDRPLHLCGYSLGARVALGLIARHGRHFQRATLIGVHPGLLSKAERDERRAHDRQLAEFLRNEGLLAFVDRWQSQPLFASQARLPAEVQRAQRRERLRKEPMGLVLSLQVLSLAEMPCYQPKDPAESPEIHLLVGELDEKFRGLAELFWQRWPGKRGHTTVVPGCGHNLVLEAPEVIVAALVSEKNHERDTCL